MKKFISLFIAVCLIMSCFGTSAVMADDVVRLSIGDIEADAGETISVPLNIENNVNGISNFKITVTFDNEYLTYTNYSAGLYKGTIVVNPNNAGEVSFTSMATENYFGDGAIVTIDFKINDINNTNISSNLGIVIDEICYLDSTYTVIELENTVEEGSVLINKAETTETTTERTTETTTEEMTETTTERVTQATTEKVTQTTTEKMTVTENDTETTTERATVTEGDTETTTRRYVSSGGGGAGASSLTVNGYTATANTEATTEITTDEETTVEEATEETTEAVLSDVRVTIGENSVVINGEGYAVDAAPYIQAQSNSTLVPLRFVALAIAGGSVEDADNSDSVVWDSTTKTASIIYDGKVIEFRAGSNIMTVGGRTQAMDNGVAAEIKEGRMFIPFRALEEALDVDVE